VAYHILQGERPGRHDRRQADDLTSNKTASAGYSPLRRPFAWHPSDQKLTKPIFMWLPLKTVDQSLTANHLRTDNPDLPVK